MHKWMPIWVAVAVSTLALVVPARGALVADYQFNNTLESVVDNVPALQNLGSANMFMTDMVNGRAQTVLHFPMGGGVELMPTTGVIPSGIYTIVVQFRFDEVSGYRRIIDFKNASSDNGLYAYDGMLYFYDSAEGSAMVIDAAMYVDVALTRDQNGMVAGYVNGMPQFSFADSANDGVIDKNQTLRFFADDMQTSDEDSAGAVARLRLFDTALSAAEIAALYRPTTSPAPALSPWALALMAGLLTATGVAVLRRRPV